MSRIMRIALPALVAAGSAYAACSASSTTTIGSAADASAFASCKTFSGSIAIETGTTENIALDGIQKLDGDLVVKDNDKIQQLTGADMTEITGSFALQRVQALNAVNFPKLTAVDKIDFLTLPGMQQLGFDAEITKASSIKIQDTYLTSLKGINIETVDTLNVAQNPYINEIDMQLGNVSTSMDLSDNNPDVNVSFPNLIWASNMTLRNCSSLMVPSLEALNSSLGLIGNSFTSFSAPNLTTIGGALSVVSNTQLTNISFPALTLVKQNLEVANNTKLRKIDGFPVLKTVSGALDMNGNFSEIDMSALTDVKGAFNIQSTGDIQDTCDNVFKPLKNKDKIHGDYECQGKLENPGGEGTDPKSSDSKKGGAASLNVQAGTALLAGVAAALFL